MPLKSFDLRAWTSSGGRFALAAGRNADANGNGRVALAERKGLPELLRDNFENWNAHTGKNGVKRFAASFERHVARAGREADRDGDGRLSPSEFRYLPEDLRDNARRYALEQGTVERKTAVVKVRDETPQGLVGAHEQAYGQHPISYAEAFRRAVNETFVSEEGPRYIFENMGGPDGGPLTNKAQLDALMRAAMREGSFSLLPLGETGETDAEAKDAWIFSVDVDAGSDHGYWAVVDRKTGDTSVYSFN